MKITEEEGKFLLGIARRTIQTYLESGTVLNLKPEEVPYPNLTTKMACFTTLYLDGNLRGCIGSLEISRPLVFDVIDNALNAALRDPRFRPVNLDDFSRIKIEISVLTPPEKLEVSSAEDLLEKLVPRKHGLIIKKGWNRATFLPVVWDQLKEKEKFLGHLCMKAGLDSEEWKEKGMEFFVYEAQEFTE
jgi:AmmeMemoRadiSam system protein A